MNVLDWGVSNKVVVGLGTAVYLWDFSTSEVK